MTKVLRMSLLSRAATFSSLAAAVLLAGPGRASADAPDDLLGRWTLVSAAGPGSEPLAQIKPGPVFFEEKAGFLWASVKGGCNSLRAAGAINGNTVALGQIVSTRMACPQPQMQVDDFLTDVLKGPGSYTVQPGGQLVLVSGQRALTLQRVAENSGDSDGPDDGTDQDNAPATGATADEPA